MGDSFYGHPRYDWFCAKKSELSRSVRRSADPNRFLDDLPKGKQCLFHAGSFFTVFTNGGVREYFCGPYGDDSLKAAFFLREIGEEPASNALESVTTLLPPNFFEMDRVGRENAFRLLCEGLGAEHQNEVVSIKIGPDFLERLFNFCERAEENGG